MYCVGLILLLEGHRKWKRLLSPTLPTNPTKSNTTGLNRFKLHRSYFMQESLEVQYYTLLAVWFARTERTKQIQIRNMYQTTSVSSFGCGILNSRLTLFPLDNIFFFSEIICRSRDKAWGKRVNPNHSWLDIHFNENPLFKTNWIMAKPKCLYKNNYRPSMTACMSYQLFPCTTLQMYQAILWWVYTLKDEKLWKITILWQ